ncbi:Rieske (2Fe-2S) protein [Peribacillus muralis]|uniref:Rieske (2Fe-2S) protein n=1 Tax=Peribacillus muralis TaxID=264697 RepID=UPI001F4D7C73|nr:Rieske (2Fe-2S) protein [Peribacillus muralis]MCK1993222.1 Rieske (2Fe-2S) protein [Peribacillus muralis]MCK2013776.1 Rieske (2Fe-2S) protein [Peribacillus muralis]
MSQLNRIEVCTFDQLEQERSKVVKINEYEIAIKNVNGKLYAFQNKCPHMGAPMVCGHVTGTMIPSEPHQYIYGCKDEIIRCPLHGWEFEMETGKSLFDPERMKIKTFDVFQEEGMVVLYTKLKTKELI